MQDFSKKEKESAKMNKRRNERGEIITYKTEIQRMTKECYEQLYDNKLGNLEETINFKKHSMPRLNHKKKKSEQSNY